MHEGQGHIILHDRDNVRNYGRWWYETHGSDITTFIMGNINILYIILKLFAYYHIINHDNLSYLLLQSNFTTFNLIFLVE